jgi:DNA repair protein RadC
MDKEAASIGGTKQAGYEVSVYRIELFRTHSFISRYRHAETPGQVAHLFRKMVGESDREHLVAFFLDTQHQVIGAQVAAVGEVNAVHCPPSSVFKGALLGNATLV